MKIKLYINFILALVILSCSRHQDSDIDEDGNVRFIKYLGVNSLLSLDRIKTNNIYLFIPIGGNQNCLKKSIEYLKNHPNENQYIIMDTTVRDVERFKVEFGLINKAYINVFYDSKNVRTSGVYSEYPYIIYVDWNEKLIKRTILNTSSIDEGLSRIN